MEYLVSVKLSEELIGQVERAAKSLHMTPEKYLEQALQEKLARWTKDFERAAQFDAIVEHIMEKNHEAFRRLASWPDAE